MSVMLRVIYAKCHCADCHCAECHYAECHYAECHSAECHSAECHSAESHYAKCHYAECPDFTKSKCLLLGKQEGKQIHFFRNVKKLIPFCSKLERMSLSVLSQRLERILMGPHPKGRHLSFLQTSG